MATLVAKKQQVAIPLPMMYVLATNAMPTTEQITVSKMRLSSKFANKLGGIMLLFSGMISFGCTIRHVVTSDIFEGYKSQYLTAAAIKEKYVECYTNNSNCDKAATDFSCIGNVDAAKSTWDIQGYNTFIQSPDTLININDYFLLDYRDFIDSVADNYKIVMINEAHHRPECRMLTAEIIRLLGKKGYHYLGIEGLKEMGDSIQQRGFPTINSGYYIREPQYANLIRVALKSGYHIFGYDNTPGSGKKREVNQAKEIYKVFQNDPTAKILIHAGWGHIREDTAILNGLMAYEFKKLSNIDPLTINQTRYMPMSLKKYENPLYAKFSDINTPSVLLQKYSRNLYKDEFTDIPIFHPRKGMDYFFQKDFHVYKLRRRFKKNGLLLCIPADENLNQYPVPAFIKEIKATDRSITLYLPLTGKYNLYLLTNDDMSIIKKIKIP